VLHLVGILFPHINDDARSKSHQIVQVFTVHRRSIVTEPYIFTQIHNSTGSSTPIHTKHRSHRSWGQV